MDGITVALLSHISTLHIQLYSAQRDSATPEFLSIRAKTQSGRAASSCRSQSERNQATLLEAVRRAKEVVSKPIARQIHAKLTASGIALMLSAVKWSCSAVHQSQLWQQPSRVERDEDGGSACSCAIVTPATDVPDFCAAAPEVVADIICEVASRVQDKKTLASLSRADKSAFDATAAERSRQKEQVQRAQQEEDQKWTMFMEKRWGKASPENMCPSKCPTCGERNSWRAGASRFSMRADGDC